MAFILSNTDEWEVTKSWVEKNTIEGREAIQSTFRELEEKGYCKMFIERDLSSKKIVRNVWVFHDYPIPDHERTNFTAKKQSSTSSGEGLLDGHPLNRKPLNGKPSGGTPYAKNTMGTEDHSSEVPTEQNQSPLAPLPGGIIEAIEAGTGTNGIDRTDSGLDTTVHTKLPCAGGAIPPKQTSSAPPPDPAAAPEPPEVEVDDVHAMPPPSSGLRPPLNLSSDLVSPQRTAKQNAPTRRSGGSDPRHAALVKVFSAEYASKFGVNYVFQGGKDGSALSSLLKAEPTLSVEQIMSVIKTGWTHNQSFIRSVSMSISRLPSIWNQLRVTAGPRVTEGEKERNYGW